MKFTLDTIRSLSPVSPKTDIIVFDDDLPGFGVRARLSGSKVFIVQYTIGNKQRRISIGNAGLLDVDAARQKAKEILTAVRMGQDPAAGT
jgi:Arm DNA-binding domain